MRSSECLSSNYAGTSSNVCYANPFSSSSSLPSTIFIISKHPSTVRVCVVCRNELKISTVAHLKYASDEDLKQIGLSRPEIRRLRKFHEKYYPNGYLGKIKRLLQTPKPADMVSQLYFMAI